MSSFADSSTETLLVLRSNLRAGLNVIASHIKAGTFHQSAKPGAAPPSQAGQLTVVLLEQVDAELARRTNAEG